MAPFPLRRRPHQGGGPQTPEEGAGRRVRAFGVDCRERWAGRTDDLANRCPLAKNKEGLPLSDPEMSAEFLGSRAFSVCDG